MKLPSIWGKRFTLYRYLGMFLVCLNLAGCSAIADKPQVVATAVPEAPPAAPPSPAPIKETTLQAQSLRLQDLDLREEQGQSTLFVKLSKPVNEFRHFPLPQPARIVLDIFGETKELSQPEIFRLDTHWLSTLRVSSITGALRLSFDVAAATVPTYTVTQEDGGIQIVVGPVRPDATPNKQVTLVRHGKRANLITAGTISSNTPDAKSASLVEPPSTQETIYTGQKISLDFKDADIKNVFRLLAEVSGLNIVVTEDVSRKVTIRLVEIPWDQALDLLIATNGLAKDEIGNVIRISTPATLKTEADVLLAAEKAQEDRELLQTRYFNVNYANAKTLEERIKPLLGPRGTLVSDQRSNIIMVRDLQKQIDAVEKLVSTLDTRTPQVLIESNLIETTPSFARALGMELNLSWRGLTLQTGFTADQPFQLGVPATRGTDTVPATPAVPPSGLQLTGSESPLGPFASLNAILSAAEQEGNIRTISRPSVVTLNNEGSTIKSTRVLRIALPASTNIASGTGAAAGTAVATERVEVGITLEVLPQVSNDGFILLFIKVVSSTLGTQSPGSVIPDELRREANAKVLVRDGETIVIGGIMKDVNAVNETGVPWLRDVPVLGWLFKKTRELKDFEELMVFITPRILAAGSTNLPSAEQLWRDHMKKTEGDKALIR